MESQLHLGLLEWISRVAVRRWESVNWYTQRVVVYSIDIVIHLGPLAVF